MRTSCASEYDHIKIFTIFSDSLSDLLLELVVLLNELQVPELVDEVTLLTNHHILLIHQAKPLLHKVVINIYVLKIS